MKKLVRFDTWYCDEFPVKGFSIVDDQEFTAMVTTLLDIRDLMETDNIPCVIIEFGTNEDFEINDISELMDCFHATEITDAQANTLITLFGKSYGYWPMPALEGWLHDRIIERDLL